MGIKKYLVAPTLPWFTCGSEDEAGGLQRVAPSTELICTRCQVRMVIRVVPTVTLDQITASSCLDVSLRPPRRAAPCRRRFCILSACLAARLGCEPLRHASEGATGHQPHTFGPFALPARIRKSHFSAEKPGSVVPFTLGKADSLFRSLALKKKWFCYGNKIRETIFFVAATKNFAEAIKRFVDRTKQFVVVTK